MALTDGSEIVHNKGRSDLGLISLRRGLDQPKPMPVSHASRLGMNRGIGSPVFLSILYGVSGSYHPPEYATPPCRLMNSVTRGCCVAPQRSQVPFSRSWLHSNRILRGIPQ